MRWLFLFVLSLNLAYIGWEMSKSPSENYTDVVALKNVKTIVLLSELKQQESLAGPENVLAEIESDTVDVKAPDTDGQAEPEKISSAPVIAVAEKAQEATVETVTPPVAKAQPDSATLSDHAVAQVKKAEVIEPVQAESSQAASCYTLGPFRDLDKLRGLTREIKSYVVKTDFRGSEENEPTLYWVYLEPEASRKKAIETGNRLKAKKIKDFYVIREGEKENGLSLGHFRNKDGAYGLAKKVTALGFNVYVEPVFRTYTVYWLDYQLSAGATIPDSIIDEYTRSAGKDNVSRLKRNCGV